MIRIEKLDFAYPQGPFRLVVDDLDVETGQSVAFIGPSGSGKTTLLHLAAGIITPEQGRIVTGGHEVSALPDGARRDFRIRHVGLVFQEFELLEYLDVNDNILLPYRINRSLTLTPEVRRRARELAADVGIGDKLDRDVRRLSQGERQRVALCRALLAEPQLVLADEPTGNLDPENKELVLDILFRYARDATLVTVTHDHTVLDRFDRVIDFAELAA
ncbi:MAG: ABC transporter ATP-binding protein [Planctomycetota bacterium]